MDITKSKTCPFLRLPLEIRNEIYRYLLCTQYTKRPLERPRSALALNTLWPRYTYHFHTSILRTNRQIQLEALYLARHENPFVHISCRPPNRIKEICDMVGISPVDLELGHRVMQIDLGWIYNFKTASHILGSNSPAKDCLICLDQLSTLCEGLLMYNGKFDELTRGTMTFNLNIFGYSSDEESIRKTLPMSTQRQLLEPFTMLSSTRDCQIDGPIDSEYKASILLQVSRQDVTVVGYLQKIGSLMAEGKQAFLDSRFSSAINAYGSAFKEMLLRPHTLHLDEIIHEGEFAGQTSAMLQGYLHWKLCSNIAAAYLKLHQWQNALDWTFHGIISSIYEDYNPRDYAVLLFRLALACKELGECERASERYRAADGFLHDHCTGDPQDRELDALMLPLKNPHDGYLEAALQETTV